MIDLSDDDALAAEYALGTLDGSERAMAEARRMRDADFDTAIAQWEDRFAPLAHAAPALAPSPDLFARVMSRLPAQAAWPSSDDNILIMRRQVRLWRGVAAVASALAAVLALWVVGREVLPATNTDQTYVAVLQHGADQPSFVVSLDLSSRKMVVTPLSTSAPPDKSYELWMIGADKAEPRSIGLIDAKATLHPHLPNVDQAVLSGATYAVTLETRGGSPTGQPTSAPLFVGKLINTAL